MIDSPPSYGKIAGENMHQRSRSIPVREDSAKTSTQQRGKPFLVSLRHVEHKGYAENGDARAGKTITVYSDAILLFDHTSLADVERLLLERTASLFGFHVDDSEVKGFVHFQLDSKLVSVSIEGTWQACREFLLKEGKGSLLFNWVRLLAEREADEMDAVKEPVARGRHPRSPELWQLWRVVQRRN